MERFELPAYRCKRCEPPCASWYFALPAPYPYSDIEIQIPKDAVPPQIKRGTLVALAEAPPGDMVFGIIRDDLGLYQVRRLAQFRICEVWNTELDRLWKLGYRYVQFIPAEEQANVAAA